MDTDLRLGGVDEATVGTHYSNVESKPHGHLYFMVAAPGEDLFSEGTRPWGCNRKNVHKVCYSSFHN